VQKNGILAFEELFGWYPVFRFDLMTQVEPSAMKMSVCSAETTNWD
jgi:hypothetical protein